MKISRLINVLLVALSILAAVAGYEIGAIQSDKAMPENAIHCTSQADTRCIYKAHDPADMDNAGLTTYKDGTGTRWYKDDDDLYKVMGW